MSNQYGIYVPRFVWDSDAGAPVVATNLDLTDVTDVTLNLNANKAELVPGGALDRGLVATLFAEPSARITTPDLITPFTIASFATLGLPTIATSLFQFQHRQDGGTFKTGANHVNYASAKGFLLPRRLRCSNTGAAELELMYYALSLTDNAKPLIPSTAGQSLVSTPLFVSAYGLGPLYVSGAEVVGIVGVEIDFGLEYRVERFDRTYPIQGAIVRRAATTISWQLKNMAYAAALGSLFGNAAPGTVAQYFRRMVTGSDRYPDLDAPDRHVKVSATAGDFTFEETAVSGSDDTVVQTMFRPTSTITVTTAIDVGS